MGDNRQNQIFQNLKLTKGLRQPREQVLKEERKKKRQRKPPTPATSWLERWTPWQCSFPQSHLPGPRYSGIRESHSSHSQYQRKQNGPLSQRIIISYLFWPVWWLPWRPAQKACLYFTYWDWLFYFSSLLLLLSVFVKKHLQHAATWCVK